MTTKEELESLKKQIADLEAKIAKEEKQEIKTYEDAYNKLKPKWYINGYGNISQVIGDMSYFQNNQCNMTSEKEAKRIKALIRLRLIAEAMNEGVNRCPITGERYFISNHLKICEVYSGSLGIVLPTFNTCELAEQALRNFKPLFEDLYAE